MAIWSRPIEITMGERASEFWGYGNVQNGEDIQQMTPWDFSSASAELSVYSSPDPGAELIFSVSTSRHLPDRLLSFGTRTDADSGLVFGTIEFVQTSSSVGTVYSPGTYFYRLIVTDSSVPYVMASGTFVVNFG